MKKLLLSVSILFFLFSNCYADSSGAIMAAAVGASIVAASIDAKQGDVVLGAKYSCKCSNASDTGCGDGYFKHWWNLHAYKYVPFEDFCRKKYTSANACMVGLSRNNDDEAVVYMGDCK